MKVPKHLQMDETLYIKRIFILQKHCKNGEKVAISILKPLSRCDLESVATLQSPVCKTMTLVKFIIKNILI